MTAQEPLALTLEEAMKRLWARGFVLVPPDGSTETWGVSVADAPDEEWGTWPEAASVVFGVSVVERRDDTAELVVALEAAREAITDSGLDASWTVAMEQIDAALARHWGER